MPKEANLAGLDRSEIDDRPRHVRAAEQNLAQHYKLILDEGTRRTYYRRGGTTLAGPSYGRALEIAELFGADYPGQIVRIPARPGQRKKPHDETTTLDQTPTQEPAPHEYLPRCVCCGAFLPSPTRKDRWTWTTERGRSHPIYYNDHRTGSVVIEGEEYEVADVARTTCRRCGRAFAEYFERGKYERVMFDEPRIIPNACEVLEESKPDAWEPTDLRGYDRSCEAGVENSYEREDLPF